MKIENIKNEFPIFDEKIQNNDLVYLDSANSSQKPKVVADKINEFLHQTVFKCRKKCSLSCSCSYKFVRDHKVFRSKIY